MASNDRKLTDFFTISSSPSMSPSPRLVAARKPLNSRDRKSLSAPSSQKSQLGLQNKPRPLTRPGTSSAPIEISSTDGDTSVENLGATTSKEATTTRQNKTVAAGGIGSKSHPMELMDTSSESASPMPGSTLKNTPISISSDSDIGFVSSHSRPGGFTKKRTVEGMAVDNASSQVNDDVHISLQPYFKDGFRTESSAMRPIATMDWEPTPSPPSSPPPRSPTKHRSFLPTPEKTSPDTSPVDIKDAMLEHIVATHSSQSLSTPPSSSVSPAQASAAHDTFRDKATQDSTARIIARIKAEALARVQSEDENEEVLLSTIPVVDTSDDDELDTLDHALGFSINAKPKPHRPSPSADARAAAARTLITSSSLTSSSDGEAMDADCSSPSDSVLGNPRRSARAAERASRSSRSSSPDPLMLGSSIPRSFNHSNTHTRAKPTAFEQLLLEETRKRKKAGGARGSALAAKLADEAFKHESDSDSELFMAKRPGSGSAPHRVAGKGKGKATASWGDGPSTPHRRRGRSRIVDSDVEDNSISADTDTSSDSGSDIEEDREGREEDERQQSAARKFLGSDTERLRNIMTRDRAVRRDLATGNSATDGSRRFWMKASKIAQQAKDDSPRREAPTDPLIHGIRNAIKNNRSLEVAILLDRWEVYPGKADPSTARSFAMALLDAVVSTADSICRSAATRSLVSLIKDDSYSPSDLGLDFEEIVIDAFGKLGAKRDALEALQCVGAHHPQGVIMPAPLVIRRDHRVHATLNLFDILGSLAAKFALAHMPDLVLLVLLVSSHRSSSPEIGRRISVYISEWLEMESITLSVQWEICQNIVRATSDWPVCQKFSILESMPQSSAPTTRLLSWTAYGMLIPREVEKATLERYIDPPPLSRLLEHLFAKNTSEMVPRELITTKRLFDLEETDQPLNYVDIMYQTDILSNMLCDVRALVEFEHKQGLARASSSSSTSGASTGVSESPSKTKARQMTPLEILCKGLEGKHDQIVDTRAADMNRTKAKDAIQRLRMRLLYQRRSALDVISHRDGTAARGKLEAHFTRVSTVQAPS